MGITTVFRWIFVVLAAYILLIAIVSLLTTRATPEIWGYFMVEEGGGSFPITHWENVIGRSKSADLNIPLSTVSNNHAILSRYDAERWTLKDLGSKNGSVVNGRQLDPAKRYLIEPGDEIVTGDVYSTVTPPSLEETHNNEVMRRMDKEPVAPWKILLAITLFQAMTIVQLVLGMGDEITVSAVLSIVILSVVMWAYVAFFKTMGRKGFEMEMIAFFMSTINLAVTTSFDPTNTLKELIAILLGVGLMIFMCVYLRDLERTRSLRPILLVLAVVALFINLAFGRAEFGAVNWVRIGSVQMQPSEIVKVAFIAIGAGTLEELYDRRNTIMYALFSLYCLGCLALMNDFGTALIFFATYLVVSFLRSGDFSRMILTGVGAGAMGLMVLKFKPHVAARFASWGHVWDPAIMNDGGYQQTRTMSFGAGGGLLGLGAGNGGLKGVVASNTDLVFGFVMEEWGLIIAILLVLCIITLSIFAVMSIVAGRSTFYTICACGAATMFMVQTMLNVFGAVDLFPLTGVTFPFVSTGGTSMLASWAMLAYFKASDMRRDASLAVRGEEVWHA